MLTRVGSGPAAAARRWQRTGCQRRVAGARVDQRSNAYGPRLTAPPLTLAAAVRAKIDAHVAAGGQPIWLEVDGGVKTDNIAEIVAAGADTCVAGSAVFSAPDADGGYKTVMQALRRAAHPG